MSTSDSSLSVAALRERKRLVGLIGDGIQNSLSPYLHEEEAAQQGLRLHYQLIDLSYDAAGLKNLPLLVEAARKMGFAGFNVTFPAKQAVMPLLDELSPDARAIGAVNTVVRQGQRLVGHNTDCSGFGEGFKRKLPGVPLNSVVLQGAGGAGAAAAHAILSLGARHLHVIDTDAARAQDLAASLAARFPQARVDAGSDVNTALAAAEGLIHATPTGMAKHPGLPVAESALAHKPWVAEIVYVPLETELVKTARRLGCRVADGGGMAVWQAVGAFELFTGLKPDAARMEAHFLRLLHNSA
jgi:shikimate dehydrogenase